MSYTYNVFVIWWYFDVEFEDAPEPHGITRWGDDKLHAMQLIWVGYLEVAILRHILAKFLNLCGAKQNDILEQLNENGIHKKQTSRQEELSR